jgi:hypothetical protein
MYTISQWCGRFGNNIQQISNAIYFCKDKNFKFLSPDNSLIESFELNLGAQYAPSRLYFFHSESRLGDGKPEVEYDLIKLKKNRRRICRDYIYKNLKINFEKVKDLGEKNIVIHIRSGDIFSRRNYYCPVVSSYIQNPLSYYLSIIENYDDVIILTEDYFNPVVLELKKLKKVNVMIIPIRESIEIMLSCRNLVTSGVSSFAISCALLSENIKNVYCSNLYLEEILNYTDISSEIVTQIIEIDQSRYISWNQWMNTDEQRKLMLEYVL